MKRAFVPVASMLAIQVMISLSVLSLSVMMPVVFFVDPKILKDEDTKTIDEITLSYTFYPVESGETTG